MVIQGAQAGWPPAVGDVLRRAQPAWYGYRAFSVGPYEVIPGRRERKPGVEAEGRPATSNPAEAG